jgi:hypothetical protein
MADITTVCPAGCGVAVRDQNGDIHCTEGYTLTPTEAADVTHAMTVAAKIRTGTPAQAALRQ